MTESPQVTCPVLAPPLSSGLCFHLQPVTYLGGAAFMVASVLARSSSFLKQPEDTRLTRAHTCTQVTWLCRVQYVKLWSVCVVCKAEYLGKLWLFGQPPPLPGWQLGGLLELWSVRHWKCIAQGISTHHTQTNKPQAAFLHKLRIHGVPSSVLPTCFHSFIFIVHLWQIKSTGDSIERHTPVYVRSHGSHCMSGHEPSRKVQELSVDLCDKTRPK